MKVDLNMSVFDYGSYLATERHDKKKGYKSHNQMSTDYELVGILGEMAFGYMTHQLPKTRYSVGGDGGVDFRGGVQVKSSLVGKGNHLIEFIDKDFTKFGWYVYVLVDLKKKKADVFGYISVKDFLAQAKKRNFGYGIRLALDKSKLNKF